MIEQKYIDLEKLSMLSICAGFDSVIHTNNNYIEVFVKKQVGFLPTVVNFLNTLLLAVEPPPADLEEYALPESLANEDTEIPLFDGSDRSVALSQNFQIGDFVYPGFRYFRLDPLLVSCLESTQKATSVEFRILPGSSYRTATTEQVDGRHHEESVRFRIGQAVEIKTRDTEDLVELAQTAVRSCGMTLVSSGRAMGIGLHVDYLYLDIRPISGEQFVILWNSGGNFKMYDRLKAFINTAQTGKNISLSLSLSLFLSIHESLCLYLFLFLFIFSRLFVSLHLYLFLAILLFPPLSLFLSLSLSLSLFLSLSLYLCQFLSLSLSRSLLYIYIYI